MKKLFTLCTLMISVSIAWAQEANCVQTLRLAQSTYEQGRLHELPGLLANCLKSGFTDEEKRQAYLLLTMSYIYLEEPEEADGAMLKLLQTDHFFEPDDDVHPAEFISLYNKFRTKSLFRAGVALGPTFNMASVVKDYSVGQAATGTGKYSPRVGFQIGLVFEKDLLERGPNKPPLLTLAPEFNLALRGYSYSTTPFFDEDGDLPVASQDFIAKISRFELNPLVKLNLKKSKWNPFIVAGPGINYLTKNTFSAGNTKWDNGAGAVSGADLENFKDTGKSVSVSGTIGLGVRIRFGGLYGTFDVRWRQDVSNFINTSQRNIPEVLFDYGIPTDDFRLSTFSINLGVQYAYFNPKKLIK